MSSILVVEHEGRYIERIQDALSSEGWKPRFVAGRPEALRAAASEQPALVLVNSDLPGAPELLRAFARGNGGPGAVALVPEQEGEVSAGELGADDVLFKPFTDQELRLMVRRGLSGQLGGGEAPGTVSLDVAEELETKAPREAPHTPTGANVKLSSQDIFGDLLAEVEQEVGGGEAAEAAEPEPAGATPPEAPAGAGAPPRRRATTDDDEIDRRLEQTLSGVLDSRPRRKKRSAASPQTSEEPSAPRRKRRKRRADADVEELLNLTLSSLEDLPQAQRPGKPAAEKTPQEGPAEDGGEAMFDDLDLSELDALAATGRRARRQRGAGSGADSGAEGGAGPAVEAGQETAMGTEPRAAPDDDPGDASWADVAQVLDDEPAGPSAVQPPPDLAPPDLAPPETPADGTPAEGSGDTFGPYTLEERIAVGGMAEVWKARMSGVEGFQKTVAIKKILPQMTDSSDFVNMFIDEAKLAAQLNHPNITHIYDLGKIGRDYYIAMEFVDGPNLRSLLNQARRKGLPLPVGLALLIGARLASALDYAHRKRDFDGRRLELVHRDVSPQNVLLSYEGDIKLCDFGIVKAVTKVSHTEMGALKGKLQYMSPEQAWGRQVDARSDIFSLGALLFEMLTGERLFAGDSEISVLDAVRECHVRSPRELNPAVPERAEEVVLHALSENPEDRFASAGDLQHGLEQILYQLRPAPSQADLAGWLREVEAAAELDEEARQAFSWAEAIPHPVLGEPGGEAGQTAPQPAPAPAGEEAADTEEEEPAEAPSTAPAAEGSGVSVLPDDDEPLGAATQPLPRIDHAPELPGIDAPETGVTASGDPAGPAPIPVSKRETGPEEPPAGAAGGAEGTAAEATGVGAVAPADAGAVEIEEGGRRGLWLLTILILLAVLAGLVWYFVFGPGADDLGFDVTPRPAATAPQEPAAAEPPAAGPDTAVPQPDRGVGDGTAGGAADGTPESAGPAAAAGDGEAGPEEETEAEATEAGAGVSMTDLQAIVDEQMARKEAEIRRQKEQELRRLEEELARVREQAEEPPPEDAAGGEGGDGR